MMAAASLDSGRGNELVEKSLSQFAAQHIPDASLEGIDDIVLSYILGVLEDLGSDDGFEVESFIEMMQAYLPGFEDVSSDEICDWIFKLAGDLTRLKGKENTPPSSKTSLFAPTADPSPQPRPLPKDQMSSLTSIDSGQRSSSTDDDDDDDDNTSASGSTDDEALIRQLLEMFPASCSLEARRCLATANGQLEDAVHLMLLEMERSDGAQSISKEEWHAGKTKQDDKKVRDSILQKYGYVDVKDDSVSHKPVLPKQEKKKMTRYLNNQVCSTKGERFVEIKKPMTDEMKKTYINLKPARSYHFH